MTTRSQTKGVPDRDPGINRAPKSATESKSRRTVLSSERKARVDAILKDGIDPHVHSGPSIAPRALDHLDLVRQMSEVGFAAVVTKDHDYAGLTPA